MRGHGYGSGEMLEWLVEEKGIEPHIPVFEKSDRENGGFGRADFSFDHDANEYTCPAGKKLRLFQRQFKTPRTGLTKDGHPRRDRSEPQKLAKLVLAA